MAVSIEVMVALFCSTLCLPFGNTIAAFEVRPPPGETCDTVGTCLQGGETCSLATDCAEGYCITKNECPGGMKYCVPGPTCPSGICTYELICCTGPPEGCTLNPCTCACTCLNFIIPRFAVTLVFPDDGAGVSTTGLILDWTAATARPTINMMSCTDGSDCACTAGTLSPQPDFWELYLSTASPADLPAKNEPVPVAPEYLSPIATTELSIDSSKYAPLAPDTTYYWTVREVSPGAASGYGDGVPCTYRTDWTSVRSFTTEPAAPVNVPPVIEDISVDVSSMSCAAPDGTISRWTGDPEKNADGSAGVNNPLSISVTVSDQDGWQDIATVWLQISPKDEKYEFPLNCADELQDYVSIGLYTGLYLNPAYGWEYALSMSVPDLPADQGGCEPNCKLASPSKNACEAITGCDWDDAAAQYWLPSGCGGCVRDWSELPFNPDNPRYAYDFGCSYPDGTPTECHSCFFKTVHPRYEVLRVDHEVGADKKSVVYTFEILFHGEASEDWWETFEEGKMQLYAMARNYVAGGGSIFSGGANDGCEDDEPCRTTKDDWTWSFDFTSPTASFVGGHDDADGPDTYRLQTTVMDNGLDDSGLRSVTDRTYTINRASGPDELPVNWPGWWNNPPIHTTDYDFFDLIEGLNGGDEVLVHGNADDMACNQMTYDYSTGVLGQRWFLTIGGDVYAWLGYGDAIVEASSADMTRYPELSEYSWGDPLALSSNWLGGAHDSSCAPSNFIPGVGSSRSPWWCSSSYVDKNKLSGLAGEGWYDTLYRYARNSDWVAQPENEIQSTFVFPTAADGIYTYTPMSSNPLDPLIISRNSICQGKQILFVNNRPVQIEAGFTTSPGSACLIVGSSGTDMTVTGGAVNNGQAEQVSGGFITDGSFTVAMDKPGGVTQYDPLHLRGFVYAGAAVSLLRDLSLEGNWATPSEIIEYDGGVYAYLLRDMLGRRVIKDFECGIVQGSTICDGWSGSGSSIDEGGSEEN